MKIQFPDCWKIVFLMKIDCSFSIANFLFFFQYRLLEITLSLLLSLFYQQFHSFNLRYSKLCLSDHFIQMFEKNRIVFPIETSKYF